jgi:hypothetical protein
MVQSVDQVHSVSRGRRINPWRELSIWAFAAMDLCWLVPWYQLLAYLDLEGGIAWRAFGVLGAVYLGANWLTRWMEYANLKMRWRQRVYSGYLAASVVVGLMLLLDSSRMLGWSDFWRRIDISRSEVALPGIVVIVVAVLLAGYRGAMLAREILGTTTIMEGFKLGFFIFLVYGLVISLLHRPVPAALFYGFLFAGLVGLNAGRISTMGRLRGGQNVPFDGLKLGGMIVSAFVIVGLALGVMRFVGQEWLHAALNAVYSFLVAAVGLLLSPIFWLGWQLISRSPAQIMFNMPTPTPDGSGAVTQQDQPPVIKGDPGETTPLLGNLVLVILLVGGIVIVFRLVRMRVWQARAAEDAEYISLDGMNVLRQAQKDLRDRLQAAAERLANLMGLRWSQQHLAAAHIRRVYSHLLNLSARLGAPRLEALTPLEYQPVLDKLYPELLSELSLITQAYQRVRYGELPETNHEIQAVDSAWARIAAQGKAMLAARKRA